MRNSLIIAIVASLGLAACSGGGPQTMPGGSQVAPLSRSGLQLGAAGFQPDASCPSKYFACVTVKAGTTKLEICIEKAGYSGCPSSGLEGSQKWSGKIKTLKGKKYTGIKAKFKPNPGNPTDDVFTATTVKSSDGKVKYAQHLMACAYPSGSPCETGEVGIITK